METKDTSRGVSRRAFFKNSTGVAIGAVAATTTLLVPAIPKAGNPLAAPVLPSGGDDLLRMQNDLQKALEKPMAQRKWAMVIDIRKCIGCSACSVACMAENNLPPGVTYRTVAEAEYGDYPALHRVFMPTNCMQCAGAPCLKAANAVIPGAMARREDGIVTINYRKMKGKKVFAAASAACPYPHSLWYDEGNNHSDGTPALQPYEKRKVREYGEAWERKDTKGVTRKCHFCISRLDAGLLPACITTCPGQAMHFGDVSAPDSQVSQLLKTNQSVRLELASGANPSIHYVDRNPAESCMQCHK
jgi:molybdopterin-containing oxidoreductase family iron-sulfur binding subunit